MNHDTFCKNFHSANHIPIAYVKQNEVRISYGLSEESASFASVCSQLEIIPYFPYILTKVSGLYGILQPKNKKDCFYLVGPVFCTKIDSKLLYDYMLENKISTSYRKEVQLRLSIIPQYTYYRFMNQIIFLEYVLNQHEIDPVNHFNFSPNAYQDYIATQQIEQTFNSQENQIVHGTYNFEQLMLEYVKTGNAGALEKFLLDSFSQIAFNEGIVGNTPLRQAKNIFIATVAMVGKMAAIPGGLDIEQTYDLIDIYSRKCEQIQTIEVITNLLFNMLLDFANRVAETKMPAGITPELFSCVQYINGHLNEPICIQDVANHIKRSATYTIDHFKKELGFNIGSYITHAKIQEAKSLLRYTDKGLGEISNYLCFSSQSYFQNVFKKVTGQTPLAYKKSLVK